MPQTCQTNFLVAEISKSLWPNVISIPNSQDLNTSQSRMLDYPMVFGLNQVQMPVNLRVDYSLLCVITPHGSKSCLYCHYHPVMSYKNIKEFSHVKVFENF